MTDDYPWLKDSMKTKFDVWLSKGKRGIGSVVPTKWTVEAIDKDQLKSIDQEVASTHDSQQETIKVRNKEGCRLFRCLVCWKYIFPDDSIDSFGDGYAHKLCKDLNPWSLRDRLPATRDEQQHRNRL